MWKSCKYEKRIHGFCFLRILTSFEKCPLLPYAGLHKLILCMVSATLTQNVPGKTQEIWTFRIKCAWELMFYNDVPGILDPRSWGVWRSKLNFVWQNRSPQIWCLCKFMLENMHNGLGPRDPSTLSQTSLFIDRHSFVILLYGCTEQESHCFLESRTAVTIGTWQIL